MALDSFKDLYALNETALRIQDYLFGRPSMCFTSLTFESGSEQPIHRDSPYFCTRPEYYYFGVWVALDHVDARNGALAVIDGGHLVQEPDRFEIVDNYYDADSKINPVDPRLWNDYQASTLRLCEDRGLTRKIVQMAPGDTLIWHPHLPHGGIPIVDKDRSRLSMVNHVIPVGVPVYGSEYFYRRIDPPAKSNYPAIDYKGRSFVEHKTVDFAHRDPIPYEEFRL